ncbi:hypothetical protein Q669_32045 [Labrenzia sp. C1B10]|nr:hypothetical protein Q669_32045 [Labrenzia sp. C1B10]ERS04171.1 hypothetical protein Q675_30750 [Labrenzia sp. C1B70]
MPLPVPGGRDAINPLPYRDRHLFSQAKIKTVSGIAQAATQSAGIF